MKLERESLSNVGIEKRADGAIDGGSTRLVHIEMV
jgi:hypothetical protein